MKIFWSKLAEWIGTFLLIVSVCLTAFDVYPLNAITGLISNALWLFVSIQWEKASLTITSLILVSIYAIGLLKHFFVPM